MALLFLVWSILPEKKPFIDFRLLLIRVVKGYGYNNPPPKNPALKGLALLRNAVAPSGLRPFGTDFLGGV